MKRLVICDQSGHRQIDWDENDKAAAKEVEQLFAEKLRAGQWAVAYHGDDRTSSGAKQIKKFDPNATEIRLLPQLVGG